MTLTEIAKTFPPMHLWNHDQQQIVAKAIRSIIGQTFVCNHPNMQGVETTVVEHHPHSSGCTLELYSPSREHHKNHSCDIFHFVEYYTPINNSDSTMTLTESNSVFTYAERLERAAQSFMKLKAEYLERFGTTFRNAIASDWQVDPLDLDAKVWQINNQ